MSLLMFALDSSQVVILTDTLATKPSGDPYLFVSKCSVIPHLEMAIAFTGVAQIGHRWAHKVQTEFLARDMEVLDEHVPPVLQAITQQVTSEFGPLPGTSTIYHLGCSDSQAGYSGYVYRSERDFESELMEAGFRVKPRPEGEANAPGSLEDMIALGVRLRMEQDARPANDRLYIGGEFVLTLLANRSTQVTKVHRFDDFDSHWLVMNEGLNS